MCASSQLSSYLRADAQCSRWSVIRDAFLCLVRAWAIKLGRDLSRMHLPPVGNVASLSSRSLAFAVAVTDAMVVHGARWTGRKCFFRTYILACLLRKRGVPVTVNVGLCDLRGARGRRMDGHCWLTLNDEPCLEVVDRRSQYPHFLVAGLNGIRYWAGFQPAGESKSGGAAATARTGVAAAESSLQPLAETTP